MGQDAQRKWADRTGDRQLWASLKTQLRLIEELSPRGIGRDELQRAIRHARTAVDALQSRIEHPELWTGLQEQEPAPRGTLSMFDPAD